MANERNKTHEVAIFEKDGKYGILALSCGETANVLGHKDPRQAEIHRVAYGNPEDARHWYEKSVKTTEENGWSKLYQGDANYG